MGDARGQLMGLGCMRLSTERDRNEDRAIAVLHAALDAGVTFLDTADAYCWDASEQGHNERLIARALAAWSGDRSRIQVATKGGLTRPEGRWVPDGRAGHLRAACEASSRALGIERIQLYQLHARDPRTPLSTSVRALASLKSDGLVAEVGLCNVSLEQIEAARRITEIAAVQVELSLWHDDNLLNGVAGYCITNGIRLIAYRPLGGPERRRRTLGDPILADLATRHAATPFEIALAWLLDLSPLVLPIPGATHVESIGSLGRARELELTEEDRARLSERFPAAKALRVSGDRRRLREDVDGEIVLIMGLPGAGKSTLAAQFVERGYERLNRDEAGGRLSGLLPALDRLIGSGRKRVVLDNTYVSRKSRAAVIEKAWAQGLPVRCVWLRTALEDAQFNAAWRMVSRYGKLLAPEELRKAAKTDPGALAPTVQLRYRRQLEPPQLSEGFSRIDVATFERRREPSFTNRALVLWCEGVLSRSRGGRRTPAFPDDVEVLPQRRETLRRYQAAGWRLLVLSWLPELADGSVGREQVEACFARTQELLGSTIEVLYCPHGGGPPICWCRKPLPGLGVVLIQRHRLDASHCVYVGEGGQDRAFARRLGFQYCDPAEFFASDIPRRFP